MRLTPASLLFSGALVVQYVGRVQALNLQFSRRAVNAYYNAPSPPNLGAGFLNLGLASEGAHSLSAGDGKEPPSIGNVNDIRVRRCTVFVEIQLTDP